MLGDKDIKQFSDNLSDRQKYNIANDKLNAHVLHDQLINVWGISIFGMSHLMYGKKWCDCDIMLTHDPPFAMTSKQ